MKIVIGLFFSVLLVAAAVACGTESPSAPQGGAAGTAKGASTGQPADKKQDAGTVAPSSGAGSKAEGGW